VPECCCPPGAGLSAPLRKHAGGRGEEGTVGRPERGALFLPAEHGNLMSQHEQLDVFGDLAAPASEKQPQHSREGEIGEGKQHPLMLPEPTTGDAGTLNLGFLKPLTAALRFETVLLSCESVSDRSRPAAGSPEGSRHRSDRES
jgi:hypothetical protein